MIAMAIVALTTATAARAQNDDAQTDLSSTLDELSLGRTLDRVELMRVILDRQKVFHPPGNDYFWYQLGLPETYNSNPASAPSGIAGSDRFDPKLQLNIGQQMGPVQLTVSSAFDMDRYGQVSTADSNTWLTIAKLNFNEVKSLKALFKPYFLYQGSLRFKASFSAPGVDTHDVGGGVGFNKAQLGLGDIDKRWDFGLDTNVTHRFSHAGDSNSVYLKPSATLTLSPTVKFLVAPSFRVRWFDASASPSRQDETVTVPAVLEWDPDFLTDVYGDVLFSVTYQRNFSNLASKRYEQWNIGPTIEISGPL